MTWQACLTDPSGPGECTGSTCTQTHTAPGVEESALAGGLGDKPTGMTEGGELIDISRLETQKICTNYTHSMQ